jgi:UMP-CMP kinase
VLGGPGAGKGTQCARLARDYAFTHLSAGDLLRAEQARPGSELGAMLRELLREGQIVPSAVTVRLLEEAMAAALAAGAGPNFLVDGFPREMQQALDFERDVVPAAAVLFFDCPPDEMRRRLLSRGRTSGRSDDNEQSVAKRLRVFVDTSMPVVRHYDAQGKTLRVAASSPPDEVYAEVKRELRRVLPRDAA